MGATRKGYMNRMALEVSCADGEEQHPRWKEQNAHSLGAQRKMATVLLT